MQTGLHAFDGDVVSFVAHRLEPGRPLDWRGHILMEAHDNLKPTSQVYWRSIMRLPPTSHAHLVGSGSTGQDHLMR